MKPQLAGAQLVRPSNPLAATSARSPGQRLSHSSFSPCLTRMRFSPVSGTTSATVARAT